MRPGPIANFECQALLALGKRAVGAGDRECEPSVDGGDGASADADGAHESLRLLRRVSPHPAWVTVDENHTLRRMKRETALAALAISWAHGIERQRAAQKKA